MRKRFNRWLWNTCYIKALELEERYNRIGDEEKARRCIKLQNLLQSLKDELIKGTLK